MHVAPRPAAADDPLFPLRMALMPVIGFVIGMASQSPMPMIYPVLMFSLMANNRKAFNPGRVLAAPLMFAAMLWLMSGFVVALLPIPASLAIFVGLVYFAGFYLIQATGSPVGMLLIVATALMSIMGMGMYEMMAALRSEMTKAALCTAIAAPVMYWLLPPAATDLHEDVYHPAPEDGRAGRAAVRALVLLGYTMVLYVVLDPGNIMLAVAGMFVLVFTTADSIWRETAQRSFSVILGGCMSLLVLGMLSVLGHLTVLLGLVFLLVLWCCNRMIRGPLPSMAYQDAASILISMVGSALATSDPAWAFLQRAGLTVVATIIAAALVVWFDQLLAGRSRRGGRPAAPS